MTTRDDEDQQVRKARWNSRTYREIEETSSNTPTDHNTMAAARASASAYDLQRSIGGLLDDFQEEKDLPIVSRSGYPLKDLARTFVVSLGDAGPIASGKLLHYTADMITSGGLLLWQRLLMDYAYDHIGVASPRIFMYLTRKFQRLTDMASTLPFEQFCQSQEMRDLAAEAVIIVQGCPRKAKVRYPTVPPETHENEEWLRSVLRTTDKAVVRRVWKRGYDLEPMLHAGNEMVYAITEGATERALFWIKWLTEEDAHYKKQYKQGLTTAERAPDHVRSPQQRTAMGYYLLVILAETYKEFREKGMIRMDEEFQGLLDIYRSPDQTQKRRMDTLAIMVQLLTDVPKWKVPASPPLTTDAARIQRTVAQAGAFFQEVMQRPLPPKMLPAKVAGGLKQKKAKEPTKEEQLQRQLEMMDQMVMSSFYKM